MNLIAIDKIGNTYFVIKKGTDKFIYRVEVKERFGSGVVIIQTTENKTKHIEQKLEEKKAILNIINMYKEQKNLNEIWIQFYPSDRKMEIEEFATFLQAEQRKATEEIVSMFVSKWEQEQVEQSDFLHMVFDEKERQNDIVAWKWLNEVIVDIKKKEVLYIEETRLNGYKFYYERCGSRELTIEKKKGKYEICFYQELIRVGITDESEFKNGVKGLFRKVKQKERLKYVLEEEQESILFIYMVDNEVDFLDSEALWKTLRRRFSYEEMEWRCLSILKKEEETYQENKEFYMLEFGDMFYGGMSGCTEVLSANSKEELLELMLDEKRKTFQKLLQ